ncbi:unnamed protein product [Callosobruchus maculatus]|uniref:Uncharacterized protein n=1 Tax=Callosobruchus maculatus TaxID=64391 RepID=A0A653DM55_CALMS|nr:unnamed protein product [Callosobruchus maculatus]
MSLVHQTPVLKKKLYCGRKAFPVMVMPTPSSMSTSYSTQSTQKPPDDESSFNENVTCSVQEDSETIFEMFDLHLDSEDHLKNFEEFLSTSTAFCKVNLAFSSSKKLLILSWKNQYQSGLGEQKRENEIMDN